MKNWNLYIAIFAFISLSNSAAFASGSPRSLSALLSTCLAKIKGRLSFSKSKQPLIRPERMLQYESNFAWEAVERKARKFNAEFVTESSQKLKELEGNGFSRSERRNRVNHQIRDLILAASDKFEGVELVLYSDRALLSISYGAQDVQWMAQSLLYRTSDDAIAAFDLSSIDGKNKYRLDSFILPGNKTLDRIEAETIEMNSDRFDLTHALFELRQATIDPIELTVHVQDEKPWQPHFMLQTPITGYLKTVKDTSVGTDIYDKTIDAFILRLKAYVLPYLSAKSPERKELLNAFLIEASSALNEPKLKPERILPP